MVDVPPSPKVHDQVTIVPSGSLDWSVKSTMSALADATKDAVGGWLGAGGGIVTALVVLAVKPLESVTANVTLYVPAAEYVCVGLVAVDVPPSPNVQLREAIVAGLTAVEVSVKLALSGDVV